MISKEEGSEENLLGQNTTFTEDEVQELRLKHCWRFHTHLWLFQSILVSISLLFFLGSFSHRNTSQRCNCEDHIPIYSPALEAIRNTGHYQRFDGSSATPNKFKGTPNAILDAAWADITDAHETVVAISEETLHTINASAEYSIRLPPKIGDGYMGSVEAFHQLHCLNMLRQATYADYYRGKTEAWKDSPQRLRNHLDHCIDILRQKLMCNADTGILTYFWIKKHGIPVPQFSVQHKCVSFDSLKDWVMEHQVYSTVRQGIERLPGAKELENLP